MAKLIGNQPNQVPTNGDLGTMAYQDYDVVAPQLLAGRRNLIINGAMQVAQRGTSATGVTGGTYATCDRFKVQPNSLGTWTVDQSTDAPNGFSNSLKVTCTTADASPAAADYMSIRNYLEAQDLQQLGFGTSNAKALVLSFYVKSNKTGSGSVGIFQYDNSYKMVSPSYTISSADTWEYKTISIPADTSGVINNDNGTGLSVEWYLNAGSNKTSGTNATSWKGYTDGDVCASNLGVGGATSDYFAITGVQLEVGSVATPFEHRSYGEELALCQRYFRRFNSSNDGSQRYFGNAYSTGAAAVNIALSPEMRALPTVTVGGTNSSSVDLASYNSRDRLWLFAGDTLAVWFRDIKADAEL